MHAQQRKKSFPYIFGLLPIKIEVTNIKFYHEDFNCVRRQGNNSGNI